MSRASERGSKNKPRLWTREEDEALIAALTELCKSGWKRENNIFKKGYTSVLEKDLKLRLPGYNLKANPHIESRLKTLKKHCDAITDMENAIGIKWSKAEQSVICDDDVWEDYVKDHPEARGLRKKPFPYYDELSTIFGKSRGSQKMAENPSSDADKPLDVEEVNDYIDNIIIGEEFNTPNRSPRNGNLSNVLEREANNHNETCTGPGESNDEEVSIDDVEEAHIHMQGGSTSTKNTKKKKRTRSSESWSSGLEGVAKMFGTLLEKHEEQFSLLVGLVGREVASDNALTDKRVRLNGELKRIPNLSLQARLRAASIIVSDPPKLDLFYSLSSDERKEWVSMLLSGLI